MNPTTTDSCAHPAQKLLSVKEARQRIIDSVEPITTTIDLDLRDALKHVLAQAVTARVNVPPQANSAMDGYAVKASDCTTGIKVTMEVIGTSLAGVPFNGRLHSGQCVRIMTGAVVPDGADAVIMQEQVEHENQQACFIANNVTVGQNVRYAGEDSRIGDTILKAGQRLGPAELGLLASVGIAQVRVVRPLSVAFFSTGDELKRVGTPLEDGQIYDSNRYTLYGLLSKPGIQIHDLGVIQDRRESIRAAFRQAASLADLVITSGGVSVGDADYVTDILGELGQINFWRMAMKPGKPLAYGKIGESVFFGLPGNPVSVMVTYLQFVRPALQKMCGEIERPPLLLRARSKGRLIKTAGRMEFQRGILEPDGNGGWIVSAAGVQESHLLSSMSKSNCFILLEAESTGAADGAPVTVQPFQDLM